LVVKEAASAAVPSGVMRSAKVRGMAYLTG